MTNSNNFSTIPTPPPSLHTVVGSFPASDDTHKHRFYFNEVTPHECISNLSGQTAVPGIHFQNSAYWLTFGQSAGIELLCEVTDLFINELFERLQLMRLPARFYVAGLPTKDQFISRNYSPQVANEVLIYMYRRFVICAANYVPTEEKMFIHNVCMGYTDSFLNNQLNIKRHGKYYV